ncbi:hypothetical protein chiPu_0032385, partial [Chiloscyllium punctatum]|nr:hypothetical protein [Chiloscyllium punctatum]
LRPRRERRGRAEAVFRHRDLRQRRRKAQERRDGGSRPHRARDRLPAAGRAGEETVRRGDGPTRRPDLGFWRRAGAAQHVHPHAAARPVVHRRQPRAMPHQLALSRAADQGDRGQPAAARRRAGGEAFIVSRHSGFALRAPRNDEKRGDSQCRPSSAPASSLTRRRELRKAPRWLEPDRRRLRRGRQQGPRRR